MFAGPSVLRGELAFAPGSVAGLRPDVQDADRYFAAHPKLSVLYILAETSSVWGREMAWEIYTEMVQAAYHRLQEQIKNMQVEFKSVGGGPTDDLPSLLYHPEVSLEDIGIIQASPLYRAAREQSTSSFNFCPFFLNAGSFLIHQGEGSSDSVSFDPYVSFAMSREHQVGGRSLPRYGPYGVVVTRSSDLRRATQDRGRVEMVRRWSSEAVGGLYNPSFQIRPGNYDTVQPEGCTGDLSPDRPRSALLEAISFAYRECSPNFLSAFNEAQTVLLATLKSISAARVNSENQ
jgi:hypothetical protein